MTKAIFVFGAGTIGTSTNNFSITTTSSTDVVGRYYNGAFTSMGVTLVSDTDYVFTSTISNSKYNFYVNNALAKSWAIDNFETTTNLGLFGSYSGARKGNYRFYYADFYDNGTIALSLVPVKRLSDGKLGLYDLVNDVFYINAGTGTFIAGPVVKSKILKLNNKVVSKVNEELIRSVNNTEIMPGKVGSQPVLTQLLTSDDNIFQTQDNKDFILREV